MNREQFLERLRLGLRGVRQETLGAILLDYEGYFDDGVQAGRSDQDLAFALGDPGRLAAELRLEIDARCWETERTFKTGRRTATAALRLAVVDVLLLVPLCMASMLCAVGVLAAFVVALAGCYVLVTAPFDEPAGGPLAAILQGVGLFAGGIAGTAALAMIYLVNALSWYGRVHRRVLRPLLPQRLAVSGERT